MLAAICSQNALAGSVGAVRNDPVQRQSGLILAGAGDTDATAVLEALVKEDQDTRAKAARAPEVAAAKPAKSEAHSSLGNDESLYPTAS